MDDLIDREKVERILHNIADHLKERNTLKDLLIAAAIEGIAIDTIHSQPAVDAVPVVHGHWIPDPVGSCPFSCDDDIINHYKCSKCGRRVAHRADQNLSERFPYCNCGAKMDEEE